VRTLFIPFGGEGLRIQPFVHNISFFMNFDSFGYGQEKQLLISIGFMVNGMAIPFHVQVAMYQVTCMSHFGIFQEDQQCRQTVSNLQSLR